MAARPKLHAKSPATAFVGRAAEQRRLARELAHARLVTLWGPPGIGKTRLAREACARVERALFVELEEARDTGAACRCVARALGVALSSHDDSELAAETGRAIAREGDRLVVLDNLEQVMDAARALVGTWLAAAPRARFLATSRERLGLDGEVAVELEPLSLPGTRAVDESEAVELFVARAAAARGEYALVAADTDAVRDVVTLLDGVPLAIELAAARMAVLSAVELRERLGARLHALSADGKTRAPRQATLRGAVAWSWELLDDVERSALGQLSVFRGGFTAAGAEAVLELPAHAQAIDAVASLRNKALVRAQAGTDGAVTLSLYATVREYAAERLRERHKEKHGFARHAAWALAAARPLAEAVEQLGTPDAMARLAAVEENLLAVHERVLGKRLEPGTLALEAALALDQLLVTRGPFALHFHLLDAALPLAQGADVRLLARAHVARGRAHSVRGEADAARKDFSEARRLAREAGDVGLEGVALGALGNVAQDERRFEEALATYAEALPLVAQAQDARHQGIFEFNVGAVRFHLGELDQATDAWERARALFVQLGNVLLEARVLGALGNVHFARRRLDEARAAYEEALARFRALSDLRYQGVYLGNLAQLHQDEGRLDEARKCAVEQVELLRRVGDLRFLGVALENLGLVELERERHAEAARALAEARELKEQVAHGAGIGLSLAGQAAAWAQAGRSDRAALALKEYARLPPGEHTLAARLLAALVDVAHGKKQAPRAVADEAPASAPEPEVRIARRLLLRALGDEETAAAVAGPLEVGPECRWARPPGAAATDLARSKALRLMLAALVERRLSSPGAAMSVVQLFAAGWPGETALPDAAANRVYVNLSRLKDLGLRRWLLRTDAGYLLEPSLEVARRDGPAPR